MLVKMVTRSSGALLLPSSGLLLLGGGAALLSTLRVAFSPLIPPTDPTLSFLTGLVSHFFRVLTERREPGEFGAELPDAWGGKEATDVEILPSLPAAVYESAHTHTYTQGERDNKHLSG